MIWLTCNIYFAQGESHCYPRSPLNPFFDSSDSIRLLFKDQPDSPETTFIINKTPMPLSILRSPVSYHMPDTKSVPQKSAVLSISTPSDISPRVREPTTMILHAVL